MDLIFLKIEVSNLLTPGVPHANFRQGIDVLFQEKGVHGNHFAKVESGHLLQKFIRNNFNFIVSDTAINQNCFILMQIIKLIYVYIPLLVLTKQTV